MPRKANSKAIMGEVKSLAMVAGGFVLGSMGGSVIDRALKVDPTLPSVNAKKFVKPVVQLSAGILGATKLKNTDMKLLASGVGASGVVSAVQVVTKKNLLAGAPSLNGHELNVYEPLAALPELPSFSHDQMPVETMETEIIDEESFDII